MNQDEEQYTTSSIIDRPNKTKEQSPFQDAVQNLLESICKLQGKTEVSRIAGSCFSLLFLTSCSKNGFI